MRDTQDQRPHQPPYSAEQRREATRLAGEIGAYKAAQQLGIGYTTLRRWTEPAFCFADLAANRARKRRPCERCGETANFYSRRQAHLGLLCRSCLATALADRRRGYTVADLVQMYCVAELSTNEIAAQTGQSQSAIYGLLRRHGVRMRTRRQGVALRPGGAPEHGKVDPTEIEELFLSGMAIPKIASEVACSTSTVKHHLRSVRDRT